MEIQRQIIERRIYSLELRHKICKEHILEGARLVDLSRCWYLAQRHQQHAGTTITLYNVLGNSIHLFLFHKMQQKNMYNLPVTHIYQP